MSIAKEVVLVVVALTLAGCDALGFKNWEWRQKLVIEVETPSGVVSGGSVVAVEAGTSPKWAPGAGAGGLGSRMRGEASFVEVAPGRFLFALLGGGDWEREVALTLFFPEPAPSRSNGPRGWKPCAKSACCRASATRCW